MITFFDIFKVINFICFLIPCVYLVKRYIAPMLFEERKKEKLYEQSLKEDYIRLQREVENSKRMRVAQEARGQWLLEKIRNWNTVIRAKEVVRQDAINKRQDFLKNYSREQMRSLAHDRAQALVIPESLAQARQELVVRYSDKKEQEHCIQKVLGLFDELSV